MKKTYNFQICSCYLKQKQSQWLRNLTKCKNVSNLFGNARWGKRGQKRKKQQRKQTELCTIGEKIWISRYIYKKKPPLKLSCYLLQPDEFGYGKDNCVDPKKHFHVKGIRVIWGGGLVMRQVPNWTIHTVINQWVVYLGNGEALHDQSRISPARIRVGTGERACVSLFGSRSQWPALEFPSIGLA